MEQIQHFFRLMGEGLATKVNFQQYLENPSRFVEEQAAPEQGAKEEKWAATPKSPWQEMFARQVVWDPDFNETHFPLEPEAELRPVDHVHEFPEESNGIDALRRLDAEGFELALPRATGIYLLGWVNFVNHRVLRKNTERRVLLRTRENPKPETLQSYLGLLKHGNTHKIRERLLMEYWMWTAILTKCVGMLYY